MEQENNKGIVSIVAVVLVALCGLFAMVSVANKGTESFNQQNQDLGTNLTYNANTQSYTDGADFRQNLQAIAERFANVAAGSILVADSTGFMQAVSPTSTGIPEGLTIGKFVEGGGVTATSTSGTTVPLLFTDFDTENVIDVTLNVQDATLSFPASSTLTGLSTVGQSRRIMIRNATTTAAMDLNLTGGTGVLLKMASSTSPSNPRITGDTDGLNHAWVTLTRLSTTDVSASVEIFKD